MIIPVRWNKNVSIFILRIGKKRNKNTVHRKVCAKLLEIGPVVLRKFYF